MIRKVPLKEITCKNVKPFRPRPCSGVLIHLYTVSLPTHRLQFIELRSIATTYIQEAPFLHKREGTSIPHFEGEQDHLSEETPGFRGIQTVIITKVGFQHQLSEPGIFPIVRGLSGIVGPGVIIFQRLPFRLRINKEEATFLALNDGKNSGKPKDAIPTLKKKTMSMRSTNFTGD
jgi:hypothetical protein